MEKQRTVGILSPYFAPFPLLGEAATRLGATLVIVTPQRIIWETGMVKGLVCHANNWETETIALPKGMYNRYFGSKPQIITKLEEIVGPNRIFNHITHFDKWETHNILANSKLSEFLPATRLYTLENLAQFLNQYGQVIVKPRRGHLGYKVYRVAQDKGGFHLYHGSKYPIFTYPNLASLNGKLEQTVTKDFLIQQFIPLASLKGRIFDLRCLVQKDGQGQWAVTGLISRIAMSYSYITNTGQMFMEGGELLKLAFPARDLVPEIMEIAIAAAQIGEVALGSLGELSVDFGLDERGNIWIIELNGKPMKEIFQGLGEEILARIYETPLVYALHLAKK